MAAGQSAQSLNLCGSSDRTFSYHGRVQVDFSVELGADDPKLEFPWSSPDGQHRYFDLKADPQLISEIAEAAHNPALRSFLSAINSKASILQTAKCDTWTSRELAADEEIFGASVKYGCYIDLVPTSDAVRFSFEAQERLAQCLVKLLQRVPEIARKPLTTLSRSLM